jgi:hypothetical protein
MQFVFLSTNAAFFGSDCYLYADLSLDQTNRRSRRDCLNWDECAPRDDMSRAQDVVTNLLASADVRINGARPWDIQVH